MGDAILRLRSLSVRDAMTKNVMHVEANQPISAAAERMRRRDVSAAPVVDEQGRCVGVISATDFLKVGCDGQEGETSLGGELHSLQQAGEDLPLEIESSSTDLVRTLMSSAVQSVAPTAALLTAAKMMCAEHIHRLPVLDADQRPVGVISTMDIVAALLNAIDEMETQR